MHCYSAMPVLRMKQRCSLLLPTEYRGLSVRLQSVKLVSPAKTAELIEKPFGLMTRVDPRKHVLHGGSESSMGRAILRGVKGASHCKV